ncbi:hypothetical protein L9F63_013256 [Diploptera punctata]|uniref:Centrosomal protein of 89 kDa n=1 Tax=Diploptera punctata TaxID=6984 RepID=A0AAD8AC13_DIPPU|nr:hypothetical protein L9F63_013256 [Diploptera punctata]
MVSSTLRNILNYIKNGISRDNAKPSVMPPPIFTSVPTLPMFVVESSEGRASEPIKTQSVSDITAGNPDSNIHVKSGRKSKRRNVLVEKANSIGEASSSRDDLLVQRRHHHHKHKHRRHSSGKHTGDLSQSETSEIHGDEQPKPKPRFKLQESASKTILLKQLERLSRENEELSKSQDSGYQQSEKSVEVLQTELSKLESNYRNLEKQRDAYRDELNTVKECQHDTITQLETQNHELREDVTMLKNLVYRLNMELDRYQQRLHKQGGNELPPLKPVTTLQEKEAAVLWNTINKNALKPLLEAYEETIKEKDDLIKNYEQNLNKFVANCKQVIAENEKLYQELEVANKQLEERTGSWEAVQQDGKLAQEQIELLTNQIQLQKDKLKQVEVTYTDKIAELTKDNELLVEKFHQYRGDLLSLRGQFSLLKEEYDKLKKDADTKVPFAVHSASVSECRRLFEELKDKYEGERSNLTSQMQELQLKKPQLEVQIESITVENKQLHIHVNTLDKLLKKTQQRCEQLQSRLVTCQVSRDAAKRQLQKAMTFAEELVAEQENLLRQLHAKQEENNSIAKLGTTIVYRMGSLKTKLKTVQKDAYAELDVIEKRIRRQETDVSRMKDEYHREVLRLRNLVKQKEIIIGRLQREKTKTEEDLEVVWRAATSEDLRIKEKLKQASVGF